MAKRKLSQQQARRVASRRRGQGKNTSNSPLPTDANLSHEETGTVLAHFGSQAEVESEQLKILRCHLRANLGDIVAGDQVIFRQVEDEENMGVVETILPRSSELQRPDSFGKLKIVAANVDTALITVAPEPEAHANLIDRYLVMAEVMGFEPILLINKLDIIQDDSPLHALAEQYQALNYSTVMISARCGTGLDTLTEKLSGRTSIFVGQSGVGKSSVIQALLPEENIKIGRLSDQVKKGRHTTTHARLYHFPDGGDLVDSPGIREFGLWHLEAEQVAQGFKEFRPFLGQCKFRNCSHQNEPNCALQKALAEGAISEQRYQSYQSIVTTLNDVDIHNR